MRNKITNPKKLARFAEIIGQPVVHAWTRGGTDHRVDAGLSDGSIVSIYKDGTTEPILVRWRVE